LESCSAAWELVLEAFWEGGFLELAAADGAFGEEVSAEEVGVGAAAASAAVLSESVCFGEELLGNDFEEAPGDTGALLFFFCSKASLFIAEPLRVAEKERSNEERKKIPANTAVTRPKKLPAPRPPNTVPLPPPPNAPPIPASFPA
jgi:hypothetical protein